jgi:hypothetical protein
MKQIGPHSAEETIRRLRGLFPLRSSDLDCGLAEERLGRAAGCSPEILDEMRLVEVTRRVCDRSKIHASSLQSHSMSQPHQRAEFLGRHSHDSSKTTLERTLAQTDVSRQVVNSPGSPYPAQAR